jgi:glycosyltransferase involved in cell wall biosynthesis
MAAGIPLIVSDFPLWRELFESAGCALFVNPLDPGAIAAAMEWIIAHPSEAGAMGARGREAARTRFNWHAESAKLVRLYERLLPSTHLRFIPTQAG